jgi:hypothetical protein
MMLEALRALIHSHRRDALTLLLLLVIGSGLFAPMMHHWRLSGDYTVHNNLAYGLTENVGEFFRNTPHFLYHVLTAASFLLIPGGDIYVAGVRVMTLAYLALIIIIYWQMRRMSQLPDTRFVLIASAVLTLGLMLIAPLTFFTPDNRYLGYFAPHVYHNPTIILMKPFAVGLFFASLRLFTAKDKLAWWWIVPYALLTGLCLVAKPSFILAYVPALGLVTAFFMLRHLPIVWNSRQSDSSLWATIIRYVHTLPVNWMVLIGGIVIPAFAILVYQAMTWTSSGGISIEPFRVFFEWTLHYDPNADKLVAFKFIMSTAFPIAVYLLHFKAATRNLMLNVAWVNTIISAAYAYLLVDNTVIAAGDFGWSAEIAVLLLHIGSVLFLFVHYRLAAEQENLSPSVKMILAVCVLLFALHVLSGVSWYYHHLIGNGLDLLYGIW